MKKTKLLLPALMAALLGLGMTSCSDDQYFGNTNIRAMETLVYGEDWYDDGETAYLYAEVPWSAITADVLNFGTVAAYVYEGDFQCPLPYVIPITYTTATGYEVVSENISYDISLGKVTFRMQDLDGGMPTGYENARPMKFRVVVTMPVNS